MVVELERFYVTRGSARGSKTWWDAANAALATAPPGARSFVQSRGDEMWNVAHDELMAFVDWAETVPRKEGRVPPLTFIDREHEKWTSDHKFSQQVDRIFLDSKIDAFRNAVSAAIPEVGVDLEIFPDGDGWMARVGPFTDGEAIDAWGATAHEALFALYDTIMADVVDLDAAPLEMS